MPSEGEGIYLEQGVHHLKGKIAIQQVSNVEAAEGAMEAVSCTCVASIEAGLSELLPEQAVAVIRNELRGLFVHRLRAERRFWKKLFGFNLADLHAVQNDATLAFEASANHQSRAAATTQPNQAAVTASNDCGPEAQAERVKTRLTGLATDH